MSKYTVYRVKYGFQYSFDLSSICFYFMTYFVELMSLYHPLLKATTGLRERFSTQLKCKTYTFLEWNVFMSIKIL